VTTAVMTEAALLPAMNGLLRINIAANVQAALGKRPSESAFLRDVVAMRRGAWSSPRTNILLPALRAAGTSAILCNNRGPCRAKCSFCGEPRSRHAITRPTIAVPNMGQRCWTLVRSILSLTAARPRTAAGHSSRAGRVRQHMMLPST
jgi:hypothetical protein